MKYAQLVAQMSLESLPKTFQWLSLKGLTWGLPSFCLQWGCSLRVMSSPTASFSSGLSVVASWSDEWHHYLVLVWGAGISYSVGREAVDVSSMPAVASCRVVTSISKMVASSTLPEMSCKGHISTPWGLGGQAHKTVPQASMNGQVFHPSSAITSCHIHFPCH